jgi:short-subunit dehydrogenase
MRQVKQSFQVCLVTGASSGIGRGVALALARRHARVALVARREEALRETAARCREAGAADVLIIAADLAESSGTREVVKALETAVWQVDLAVLAAGAVGEGPFEKHAADNHARLLELNLGSPVRLAHALGEPLKTSRGVFAVVSSHAAWHPFPYAAVYAASKAGLSHFARSLRLEWAPLGIRVARVFPSTTESAITRRLSGRLGWGFRAVTSEEMGEKIVQKLERGCLEVRFWGFEEVARLCFSPLPRLTDGLTRRLLKILRQMAGGVA